MAVAFCLAFNRRKLDAKTLWTRLDSAVGVGLSEANGGDVHAFVNAACGHLLTDPNVAVSAEFQSLMSPVFQLDDDESYAFIRYLSKSRFTLIAFARQAWEERKDLATAAKRLDKEAEESEVSE